MPAEYWNHNVHYHPVVLAAVPDGCRKALDVGCGDGLLVARLCGRVRRATGIDRSAGMIRLARERELGNAEFLEADLRTAELPEGGYDFISAVAVVHHLGFERAVGEMTRLLAPGGRMVIIGLAYNRTALDWIISGLGVPASRIRSRLNGGKAAPEGMPIKASEQSWGEVRREARRLLPGCRFRRHLLWRYSVVWDKPA